MPASPTRHRVAVVLALVGVAVSALTWTVSSRLAADAGYTSFCNIGGVVNCDVVLSSRWGQFLGVSVSVWAMIVFAVGALLALPGALGSESGGLADLALLGLASASLGFGLVLAFVATLVIGRACPLCLTLDAIILLWFVTVAPLASRFQLSSRAPWLKRRAAAYATALASLLVAVIAGTVEAMRTPGTPTTLADVQALDPKFYAAYAKLPVLPAADVLGTARHAKGKPDAGVTIVEFSDFQCPACAQAFADLRDLARARPDVRIVFRHFPLDSTCNASMQHAMHADACQAAAAAECAGQLGKFWEYHDLLFENQRTLDRDSLFRYARDVGLDIASFRTCLDDPATMERVRADVDAGMRAGIESTPTLFINGRRVEGALERPYYDFALVIEKDIHARAGQAPQGGS